MKEIILDAEAEVDRITNTTYWAVEHSGTATAGGNTTLTDSGASFGTSDELVGDYVWIYGGTGSGQLGKISAHTGTQLTVDTAWDTNPDTDSTYRVIHSAHDPRREDSLDGNDTTVLFLPKYPLRSLNTVTINSTSVTTSYIYQTDDTGKLELGSSAEVSRWTSKRALLNVLDYWYGVYTIPREIKTLTAVIAAIEALNIKWGGHTTSHPQSNCQKAATP